MKKTTTATAPTEHQETVAVVRWWNLQWHLYADAGIKCSAESLLHVPNEGRRSPMMASILKSEGMRPGTPDLFLAVPSPSSAGLWLEMKKQKGGRVSASQARMADVLKASGYTVKLCHGAVEAIEAIKAHLRPVDEPKPKNANLTGRPYAGIVCRKCGGIMTVERTVHAWGYKRQYCKCLMCGTNRCVMRREYVQESLISFPPKTPKTGTKEQ